MLEPLVEYVLVHQRWLLVVFFLLPLSTLYDAFYFVRCKLTYKLLSNPRHHGARVKEVQRQVRQWAASGSALPMCTGRPGWQTMSFRRGKYKHSFNKINVNLMDVLQVDHERKVVVVEPLVTMGQLTSVLNANGWTIPIVPELDDLTVGGLVNGTGIETSSHIFGLFQHICEAFELVLADGSLVRCSREERSDLFYSVPWSHGTLGFLVAAELRIVPAKKYVRMRYIPVQTSGDIMRVFSDEVANGDNDFVEGLVYSRDTAVIMSGRMTDQCEINKLNEIGKFHKKWFFAHAQSYLTKVEGEEYIPLRDYYHRHSRSLFWEIQDIIPFGNQLWFRWLCGWMVPPKVSFLKLTQTKTVAKFYEKYQFIQDVLVPLKDLPESLKFLDDNIRIYPLWLCPFKLFPNPGMVHPQGDQVEMFVDVGLYGLPRVANYEPEKHTRLVEAFVRKVHGFQMLYGDTYQTREEFRQMFDHTLYDRLRNELQCSKAFPDVYDKICKSARY